MIRRERDGVAWLQFELLSNEKDVVHGVFLRSGGVSSGSFDSLNMSVYVGDKPEHVKANMQKAKEILNIGHIQKGKLVHGDKVGKIVQKNKAPNGEQDALITACRDVGIMITHADCQAAIFYDPINKVIANVHAGWRGSVLNIYEKTIDEMKQHYGTKPEDLLVCLSPSLGPEDAQFLNYKTELPEHFWEYQHKPLYFDFWAITKAQLKKCGVLDHHIEVAGISTLSCQDFFSYRRDKVTGRNGTVIALVD